MRVKVLGDLLVRSGERRIAVLARLAQGGDGHRKRVSEPIHLSQNELPVIDGSGVPLQTRGVTASRGIYFLGLHWMHTFRSAILLFHGAGFSLY